MAAPATESPRAPVPHCEAAPTLWLPAASRNVLLAMLWLVPMAGHALPGDRDQPIHITADKALRDEVKGVTVYSGNVELEQGSMEMEADKLTIYHNTDVADEIIAEGNPARMRQQPEQDKAIVHADAKVITYYKNEERVHLKTDARIEQEGSVVEGDAIDYFIAKQLITAESDQSRKNDKVVVVIQPNLVKEPDENGGTPGDKKATSRESRAGGTAGEAAPELEKEGVSGTTESE